jgi:hypothetical protein
MHVACGVFKSRGAARVALYAAPRAAQRADGDRNAALSSAEYISCAVGLMTDPAGDLNEGSCE